MWTNSRHFKFIRVYKRILSFVHPSLIASTSDSKSDSSSAWTTVYHQEQQLLKSDVATCFCGGGTKLLSPLTHWFFFGNISESIRNSSHAILCYKTNCSECNLTLRPLTILSYINETLKKTNAAYAKDFYLLLMGWD